MAEIKYEIVETVAVLSEGNKGWKKELNLISWNGREPKYDIRDWSEDHTKMGKGVTLSLSELQVLKESIVKLSDLD
ncbi:YdbC family protein [Lysinibacillus sp. NPDC058147]|uniref:YdbC family protein n=1 Tax=unclassified Lysinibacillus TaxID=2636778 RepID=UPI0036DC969D